MEAGLLGRRLGRSLVLAAMLGAAGCASSAGGGGPPARDILSWQGQSAAALQQGLGPPDAVDKLASGETVMIYRWSHSQIYGGYAVSMGGYSQLGTQYVPTQVVSMNCQARFTIGADDRPGCRIQGNGCLRSTASSLRPRNVSDRRMAIGETEVVRRTGRIEEYPWAAL
jgi:hypothetical protein